MTTNPIPGAIARVIRHTILVHEGGYVNNPADPGGETKYGISKRSYPHLDIRKLTIEQAVAIYYRDWWQKKLGFLQYVPSLSMAAKIFDIGINTGEKQVVRLCQRALKACGIKVKDDGVAGEMTLTALYNVEEHTFLEAFRAETAAFYESLARQRPASRQFLAGWLKRAWA